MTQVFAEVLPSPPDPASVSAALPRHWPFLLESAAHGPLGKCSILLRTNHEVLTLETDGTLTGPGKGTRFLDRLKTWYLDEACEAGLDDQSWPFAGGWFVYLGYELAGEIEPVLDLPTSQDGLPIAFAARCDGALLISHGATPQASLIAESPEILQEMKDELASIPDRTGGDMAELASIGPEPAGDFEASVRKIHEYLLDGDVFQVNLSRAWHGHYNEDIDPGRLYRSLRRANPAPFAGLMHWEGKTLLSSSPERLVETRGDWVQTRPIAGTHPRHEDPIRDRALSEEMLANPKERAEHIMLIDLERNDLGRVCETGSVEVDELMVVETYAHVHHIVSNVRGLLKPDTTPVDVIRAVFPGGTITGCPKVRCMEIIAELEKEGRSFYTGSMGYIDRFGNMDLNILIRSLLVDGRSVSFRTGAGIVADSIPAREVAETVHKARGILAALGSSSLALKEV